MNPELNLKFDCPPAFDLHYYFLDENGGIHEHVDEY